MAGATGRWVVEYKPLFRRVRRVASCPAKGSMLTGIIVRDVNLSTERQKSLRELARSAIIRSACWIYHLGYRRRDCYTLCNMGMRDGAGGPYRPPARRKQMAW